MKKGKKANFWQYFLIAALSFLGADLVYFTLKFAIGTKTYIVLPVTLAVFAGFFLLLMKAMGMNFRTKISADGERWDDPPR